jgi:hypothetical protein
MLAMGIAETSLLTTDLDIADRPESVSRFSRCRSARISAAP